MERTQGKTTGMFTIPEFLVSLGVLVVRFSVQGFCGIWYFFVIFVVEFSIFFLSLVVVGNLDQVSVRVTKVHR